jgi:hypothetical protein
MNKAEPALLTVLLALVLATLAVRLTLGKYMATSMTQLDCRLGYYGLLSFATYARPGTMEENADWIAVSVAEGHFLFSKPAAPAHPMVVRRKLEAAGEGSNVVTEGCAFGDRGAYKEAMTQLPPAEKAVRGRDRGVELKVVLSR